MTQHSDQHYDYREQQRRRCEQQNFRFSKLLNNLFCLESFSWHLMPPLLSPKPEFTTQSLVAVSGGRSIEEAAEWASDRLALRDDSKRADARPRAEEMATAFDERLKILDRMKRNVAEFADDIAPIDAFHKDVKVALKDSLLATRLGAELFEGPAANGGHVERMVEHLEGGFRERAEGLVVREQETEGVNGFLKIRHRLNDVAGSLKGPVHEFADKDDDKDPLRQMWRKILETDVAVVRVAERVECATADIDDAVREFFSQILVENENGRLYVQPPELPEEDLVEGISDMFRQYRAARRNGRDVDAMTEKIVDRELQAAMRSAGGKLTFGGQLQQRLMADVPDGLLQWAADHFDETPDGIVIRDEHREEISEMIRQVEEVSEELKNADF